MGIFALTAIVFFVVICASWAAAGAYGREDHLSSNFAVEQFKLLTKKQDIVVLHRRWDWRNRNEVRFEIMVDKKYGERICEKTTDPTTVKLLTRSCLLIAGPFINNN